jgi:tetratricopeptide (TPR) repeat protein
LLQHRFFREAAGEYRRALFLLADTAAGYEGAGTFRLGLSLGASGDLAGAAAAFQKAADIDPALRMKSLKALAGFWARRGDYDRSRLELSDLLLFTSDSQARASLSHDIGWLDLQMHAVTSAATSFERAGDTLTASGIRGLGRLHGRKNTTAAMLMSSLIPGSGEVYAGRPLPGLLGLGVTGASAVGTWLTARSGDWVGASVILSVFFLRFYNGSRQNAAAFSEEFNERLLRRRVAELTQSTIAEPDWFGDMREIASDR